MGASARKWWTTKSTSVSPTSMKPVGRDWISNANSISHSAYLGLSPAYFFRAMLQVWNRGLPFVGGKFGHMTMAKEILGAQGTALQMVFNSIKAATSENGVHGLINAPVLFDGLNLTPAEMDFMRSMHAAGKFDLGQGTQLARAATTPSNLRMQDVLKFATATVQYAEMSQRAAMALASFRLARSRRPELLAKGMTPTEYALWPPRRRWTTSRRRTRPARSGGTA
jgi:hypothetical protein